PDRCDDLNRLAGDNLEFRAQRLVAAGDLIEAGLEGRDIQHPTQPQGKRNVVERAVRAELIQKPKSFLGKGCRPRALLGQLLPQELGKQGALVRWRKRAK